MIRKREDADQLTAKDLAEFRDILLSKQSEILASVWSMEDGCLRRDRTDLSNLPFHMADMGADNYELENTVGLMESERRILRDIQDALARIDSGTYGVCEVDGKLINKTRLHAIPWARFCLPCATRMEKGSRNIDKSSAL